MNNILLSHNQFLDKYTRLPVDDDGWFGIQCVDLAKLYAREVLGVPLGVFWGSARTGWYNKSKTFDLKKWEQIKYTPGIKPIRWDIIFYDTGTAGHVAIVHDATKLDILVLEQNWATGKGKGISYDAINLETKRDYRDVLGWYRLKK